MPVKTIERRPRLLLWLVALASEAIFLFRLTVPTKPVFDEVHYLPAARALLALSGPANIEHPLLAKELIAAAMWLFGDTPFGWRFASTLAGAATVAAVFALTHLLTGRVRAALLATAFALLGFTIYIQARIAMLDTFLVAFLMWGVVLLAGAMRDGSVARWSAGSVLMGLATACKWAAAPYVAAAGVTFLLMRRKRPSRWPGLGTVPALALLGGLSVAAYFLTFAPAFFYAGDALTLRGLPHFQWDMYLRQTQKLPPHTYQSTWWTWPLLIRPIWYLYEPVDGAQRGILLLGNPAVMWGGLIAVAACYHGWVKTGAARLLAPAALWTFSVAIFAIIPKSLGFYYYYYPSSVLLCVVLAVALDHWRVALGRWIELYLLLVFALWLYFLPVLSAEPLANPAAFHRWTWFDSWV
ncbi:glycosyltransferase family 39 protein [Sphingomonas endophytica]|uniref:Polyprenol-phosphate-mannose--protein mannosyltransferase n=1 Tax=Sphingomonas endophytica TaxID=869719 RepID=A0A147I5L5_9SPHN|nr:glycosyltransferase family 39 protein [Sphingomonas endophytica]KTT73906.1 dolichyl-phosphate-mannose-protein mannosyltransferase [Sphingomonas endophytica]